MTWIVPPYVAHQGGWDEILFFAVPIVLAVAVIVFAERRLRRRSQGEVEDRAEDVADDRRRPPGA